MKKAVILAGIAVLIILAILYERQEQPEVCFHSKCFKVELATTPEKQDRGLMYREKLDADAGMLFIFKDEGVYPFWMKNMLIPLDILWLDDNKQVVYIIKNFQPCESDPCPSANLNVPARYVLELNAGTADRAGIAVGDTASFSLP